MKSDSELARLHLIAERLRHLGGFHWEADFANADKGWKADKHTEGLTYCDITKHPRMLAQMGTHEDGFRNLLDDVEIELLSLANGAKIRSHFHKKSDSMVIIVAPQKKQYIRLSMNGTKNEFAAVLAPMVTIPRGMVHGFRNEYPTPMRMIALASPPIAKDDTHVPD